MGLEEERRKRKRKKRTKTDENGRYNREDVGEEGGEWRDKR